MAKLIVLRGNSGSGKTTVARALQQRLGHNVMLLSQDAVRRELLRVPDGADTPALPLLELLLEYGAAHCEYVILEGILNARWYEPLLQQAAARFGSEIYAYYYDLSFEQTLLRHATKPNCADFGEAQMRGWFTPHDLTPVFQETVFSESVSVGDALAQICAALGV